jgi:hypothetical protein
VAGVGTHAELMRDCEAYRLLHGGAGPDEGRLLRAVPQV